MDGSGYAPIDTYGVLHEVVFVFFREGFEVLFVCKCGLGRFVACFVAKRDPILVMLFFDIKGVRFFVFSMVFKAEMS